MYWFIHGGAKIETQVVTQPLCNARHGEGEIDDISSPSILEQYDLWISF
jgi:hypothetical protein